MEINDLVKEIITKMWDLGYEAYPQNVVKNGVTMHGIIIETGESAKPIYYVDEMAANNVSAEKIAQGIVSSYQKTGPINISDEELLNKDNIEAHITIGSQRVSSENIVKRNSQFEGIEEYLFVSLENFSFKITHDVLNKVGIDEQDAWDKALCNLKKQTKVESMSSLIGIKPLQNDMYILSNDARYKGAAAYLDRDALQEIAGKYNTDRLVMLPSSIHEVILVPYPEDGNIDSLTNTIRSANRNIAPEEQLADRPYVIAL